MITPAAAITAALAVALPPVPAAPCVTLGWYAPRTVTPGVPVINSSRVGTRTSSLEPPEEAEHQVAALSCRGYIQKRHVAEVWPVVQQLDSS
jgi:hypothetical protein